MDRKDKFCFILDIFVFLFYLYIVIVFLNKVISNEVIISILTLIVTTFAMLYCAEDISCRIYRYFHKDEENELMIMNKMNIIDKTFICNFYFMLGIIVILAYIGKLVIDSMITDKSWKLFVDIIYTIIVVFFSMGVSTIICDKIKKLIKRIIK